MSTATGTAENLPDDTEALRALVIALVAERDALISERDALAQQNDRIRHLLLKLKRMQFGAKSERLPEAQLQLGLEDLEQAIARNDAEAEKRDAEQKKANTAKRRANRGALPAHLPRIDVTLVPEDIACPCCRVAMTVIGEDTSERLDVVPAKFRVIVTHRPKFVCRSCADGVVQMPAPARLIEGGIPTEAMVAHVLVARYADHLPLYRQAQIMARQGVMLDRSTLSFWMGYAAAELPWSRACANSCCARHGFSPMKRLCRCSILAAGAPSRAISGRSRAMTGRGVATTRPPWFIVTRPAVGTFTPPRCSAAFVASCNAMVIPPTRNSRTAKPLGRL
jgi:transposase